MKRFQILVAFAIVAACGHCLADEPTPKLDEVLAKWEAASKACHSFDAKVIIYKYDGVFSSNGNPDIGQGRFYCEAPNLMHYETSRDGINPKNGQKSKVGEVWIWKGDETLFLFGSTCDRITWLKGDQPQHQDDKDRWSIFAGFLQLSKFGKALLHGPREAFPVVVDIHAADLRARFEVTVVCEDRGIILTAVPKRKDDSGYRKLEALIDPKTYMTTAMQVYDPNGNDRVVYEFADQKINVRPSDRDALFNPKLDGLSVYNMSAKP